MWIYEYYLDFFGNKAIFKNQGKLVYINGLGVETERFNPIYKSFNMKKELYGNENNSILAVCFRPPRPNLDFSTILKNLIPIIQKYPNFYFAVGTGGTDFPDLKQIALDNKIEENILFIKNLQYSELQNYIAQGDIYIDPVNLKKNPETISSGISGSLLESMSCGLIPVVGKRPGLENYFTEELFEFVYIDMERDLANYIEKAIVNINNKSLKESIRNIVVEKASWERNVNIILNLLINKINY